MNKLTTVKSTQNVYGSEEPVNARKLYSSTSERKFKSLVEPRVNFKESQSVYTDNVGFSNGDEILPKRRLTTTSLTELPSQ